MNTKLTAIAASIAFSFAAGAYAQTSSGGAGSYGQGTQSQQPTSGSSGGSASTGQQSQKQQIQQQHKAAMEKCEGIRCRFRFLEGSLQENL